MYKLVEKLQDGKIKKIELDDEEVAKGIASCVKKDGRSVKLLKRSEDSLHIWNEVSF